VPGHHQRDARALRLLVERHVVHLVGQLEDRQVQLRRLLHRRLAVGEELAARFCFGVLVAPVLLEAVDVGQQLRHQR